MNGFARLSHLSAWLIFGSFLAQQVTAQSLNGIRGVNLGNWLLFEPWMAPVEWQSMGGEQCSDCSTCAATEWGLVQKLGQTKANAVFNTHWNTWFNQTDVNNIQSLGLNFVRIPVGFWIIEPLVQKGEFYPRGGLPQLKRGLRMLKAAGINAQIDIHALPGTSAAYSQFAGRCTGSPQFYTTANYNRGLQASAVLTALIHADPDFANVVSLEAVNEPLSDPKETPGLGQYYKSFAQTVRATEQWLGMACPNKNGNLASTLPAATKSLVQQVLKTDGVSPKYYNKLTTASMAYKQPGQSQCLVNAYAVPTWQGANPNTNNPTKAGNGPALYDEHTYLSFGYVTQPNPTAYMQWICNYDRFANNNNYGVSQSSMFIGEWWLAAEFSGNDTFYRAFGDAQKLQYSKGAGWVYWSFKIEAGNQVYWNDPKTGVIRDYVQAVNAGLLKTNPNSLFDQNVCAPYVAQPNKAKGKIKRNLHPYHYARLRRDSF